MNKYDNLLDIPDIIGKLLVQEKQKLVEEIKEAFNKIEANYSLGNSSSKQRLVLNREQFWAFILEEKGREIHAKDGEVNNLKK